MRRFIGLDLTDPYASVPRDVDVAIVDAGGRCDFAVLPAFAAAKVSASTWLSSITTGPASDDVLIIDGPLGLANAGSLMRECERLLGTPGKTPDRLPVAGSKPFAGYVRGSVELAQALLVAGWKPAGRSMPAAASTMLEAFPGGTWTPMAGARMPHKTTAAGIAARATLLSQEGLTFARTPRTHDELDAALCAWLGWKLHREPQRVTTVGQLSSQSSGLLREGVILQVAGNSGMPIALSRPIASPSRRRASVRGARSVQSRPAGIQLPAGLRADWVYFATPARADRWERTRGSKREFGEEGGRPRARRSSPGALPRGARWRQRG